MSKTNATIDLFSCDDNTTCKVTFLNYNKGLLGNFQLSQKYIEILNRANIGHHQSTGQPLKGALEKLKVISMYAQSLNPLLRIDFADGDSYLISGFWQDADSGDHLVTKVHKSITEIVGYGRKLPCVIEFFETVDNKELRSQGQLEGYFISTMKCMLAYYQRGLNDNLQRNFLIEHLRSENSFKRFLEEHIVRQQMEIPVNIKEYGDDERLFKVVFNDVEYYVFRQKGPDDSHREYYSVTKVETNMQKETENTKQPAEPEATRITALEKEVAALKQWKSDVGDFFIHPSLREATPSKEFTTALNDIMVKSGLVPGSGPVNITATTNHPEENSMSKPHPSEQNAPQDVITKINDLGSAMSSLSARVKELEDCLNKQHPAHGNWSVNQNTNHYPWHNPGQNPYVNFTEFGKRDTTNMPVFQTQADQGVPYSGIPFYTGPAISPEKLLLREGKAVLCLVNGSVYRLLKDVIIADILFYNVCALSRVSTVATPMNGWDIVTQSSDLAIPDGAWVHSRSGPSIGLLVRYPGKKYDYQIA